MHWVTARRRLVSTSLYGTEYPARFVLHSGTGLGSGRSCHRYRIFTRRLGHIVLHLYDASFRHSEDNACRAEIRRALARTLMYIGVPMGLQFSITAMAHYVAKRQ